MNKTIFTIISIISILCMISFVGCGRDNAGNTVFQATILEIGDSFFLVEPVEGCTELISADQITIPMKKMEASPEPEVGDIIEITYSGEILETYPAQIKEIYSIKVVQDLSKNSKSQDTTTNIGTNSEWKEPDISSLFLANAEPDWQMQECVSFYDFAFQRVGAILYTENDSDYIKIAFIDSEGNMQHCGIEAVLAPENDVAYHGNGEVTFEACTKDGIPYMQRIIFSESSDGINIISEAIKADDNQNETD